MLAASGLGNSRPRSAASEINHVNADHVHALIDLPTGMSIEEVVQLLKGSSSDWINTNDVIAGKFAWGEAMEPSSYQNPT